MRIVCPDCAATYDVPDGVLVGHRPVRCARCGTEWTPGSDMPPPAASEPTSAPVATVATETPFPDLPNDAAVAAERADAETMVLDRPSPAAPEPEILLPATAATVPPPGPEPPVPPAAVRMFAASAGAAWAASLLLLLALGWAAYAWRGPIMNAWPPSERVYFALGLA